MESFDAIPNQMVSNSAAAINASDDISTLDPDESILSLAKGPRRRQHDEDESDNNDEDDLESLATQPIDGQKPVAKVEEEKELPAHACAYVLRRKDNHQLTRPDTAASTTLPLSSDV